MASLNWTTTPPTQPGWYWAIADYGDTYTVEVVQVIINAHESYVLSSELDERDEIHNYDMWLGPISEPELPTEFK